MSNRKQNRRIDSSQPEGESTNLTTQRRKWAKKPPALSQGVLFADEQDKRILKAKADQAAQAAARRDRSAATGREHRPADAADDGSLFQSYGHCCDKSRDEDFPVQEDRVYSPEGAGVVVGQEYRVRPCNCRRWFCPSCGPRMGWKLRGRLGLRLAEFTAVFGITLTVDGTLFTNPLEAWLYVMTNRVLSRFIRELDRRELLHSKAYFWSVEFQKKTEQPHWHMLVDATAIAYGEIVEIWSRFRPPTAPPLSEPITKENYQGKPPAFGSVRFTKSENVFKAAYYATKYLTKYPNEGYPAWVLDRQGRMPRYGHSHRFFPRVSGHDAMCFCSECRGVVEPPAKRQAIRKKERASSVTPNRELKTIRQRLEQCGQSCSVVQVSRVQLNDGTIVDGKGKYAGKIEIPFRDVCEYFENDPNSTWQLNLAGEEVTELERVALEWKRGEAA